MLLCALKPIIPNRTSTNTLELLATVGGYWSKPQTNPLQFHIYIYILKNTVYWPVQWTPALLHWGPATSESDAFGIVTLLPKKGLPFAANYIRCEWSLSVWDSSTWEASCWFSACPMDRTPVAYFTKTPRRPTTRRSFAMAIDFSNERTAVPQGKTWDWRCHKSAQLFANGARGLRSRRQTKTDWRILIRI